MKRIMFVCFMLIGLRVSAQDWKVVDWPDKSQSEIRSAVKVWIADYFKSAKDVIQLDEADRVMVKGSTSVNDEMKMGKHVVPYQYNLNFTIDFQIKDAKFRYIIKDLIYSTTYVRYSEEEFKSAIDKQKVEAAKSKGNLRKDHEESALSHERILEKGKLALKVIGDDIEQIPAGANKDNW